MTAIFHLQVNSLRDDSTLTDEGAGVIDVETAALRLSIEQSIGEVLQVERTLEAGMSRIRECSSLNMSVGAGTCISAGKNRT